MKIYRFITLLVLAFGFSACDEAENPSPDTTKTLGEVEHFVFGTFFGKCIGNCTNVYKLKGDALYADKLDRGYPDPQTEFQSQSLEAKSVNKAKELLKALPKELLAVDAENIGCPNCVDQGGFYVEIKIKGQELQYWRIDMFEQARPDYLKDFLKKTEVLVEELKEK
jgi:hypothetical protein